MPFSAGARRGGRRPAPVTGLLVVAATAVAAWPVAASAATVQVATSAQLVRAVAAARPGDVIEMQAGTYTPTRSLRVKTSITLRGRDSLRGGSVVQGSAVDDPDSPSLIVVEKGGALTVVDATLVGATPAGFVAEVSGGLRLAASTVAGATSDALVIRAGGRLDAENATIADNVGFGVIVQGGGVADLRNATVAGNLRGGLYNDLRATVRLRNTVVATPDETSVGDCLNPVRTSVASMDYDGTCGVQMTGDALLGPLQDNGGPTDTRAPGGPSPARGAGRACPPVDQRHAPRPPDACDIGAVQTGAAPPPPGVAVATSGGVECPPLVARDAPAARRISVSAVLASSHASFALTLVARRSAWSGGGVLVDSRSRRRLRVLAPRVVRVDGGGRVVSFRAPARPRGARRAVCLTVRLETRGHGRVVLRSSSGLRRAETVRKGSIRLVVSSRGRLVTYANRQREGR